MNSIILNFDFTSMLIGLGVATIIFMILKFFRDKRTKIPKMEVWRLMSMGFVKGYEALYTYALENLISESDKYNFIKGAKDYLNKITVKKGDHNGF